MPVKLLAVMDFCLGGGDRRLAPVVVQDFPDNHLGQPIRCIHLAKVPAVLSVDESLVERAQDVSSPLAPVVLIDAAKEGVCPLLAFCGL